MAMWASSKLVFGFDLGEGIPEQFVFYHGKNQQACHEDDVANAFTEWGAKQLGVDHPGHFDNMNTDPQWKEYNKAVEFFFESCPVDIITYNRYTNRKYFLALKNTKQSGDQFSPQKVETYPVDKNILKYFCEKYNLPYQEPDWYMLCIYG